MSAREAHGSHRPPARARWTRTLGVALLAWALATAWGSVVQTQWNLHELLAFGVEVPAALRWRTTAEDLLGFGPVYGGIVAAGGVPAGLAAAWFARRWPAGRSAWFALAGAVGLVAAVRAVDAVAPMPAFIDATRHLPGLASMAAGAALAGLLLGRVTAAR
ncbi:hypothetical protein [Piscinibacter sakaiensis]|nr:hypothetical protein [Piscinibacter sakaiensis]